MQFELRQQVIEPVRQTFTPLVKRYGDRPATRYEEGSVGIQSTEHFHYRPLWDPEHDIYDPEYTALKLSDPDAYTDPRQFYYTPYVVNRAALHEAFGRNLSYVVDRGLLTKMPQPWQDLVAKTVLPLRYYESGAQLINVEGGRFAYGTTIEQVFTYASFDRIGNAQILSRIGIALGENSDAVLATTKPAWLDDPNLQGLRRLIEELLVERDWALSNFGLDLCDRMIFPLLTAHLDEAALLGGAGAYSLLIQQLGVWWTDQRKWLNPLISAWVNDPEYGKANIEALQATVAKCLPQATAAVIDLAQEMDSIADVGAEKFVASTSDTVNEALRTIGIEG
ncbi:phenol 2-monooxygenase [Mycolicibacterium sp. CH28]|uniref:phenol 2-monooxygenase n=1 Tax=Mycolicibacterium sp. CH28 TaxID=2512237 RepID=UPI001081EFE4|nr:phenol 2-monooxygenase [Mycolicibacterium sp. CH28]TGD86040.1 phenol 2-monooxygenase [Mycolicibacterium sp. CH28]